MQLLHVYPVYLSRLVLGSSKEVCPIGSHLNIGDLHAELMGLRVLDGLSRLSIILAHGSILVACDNKLVEIAPGGNGCLALAEGDGENRRIRLFDIGIHGDWEHNHGSKMSHAHLRHGQQQFAVVRELDALDGRREVPRLQAPSGLHLPQLDCVIGRSGGEESSRGIDINRPQRSLVASVCSESLAVCYAADISVNSEAPSISG